MDQKTTEAIAAYQEIVEQAPKLHSAANNLAWLLATTADSKLRDPVKAVQIATKICTATKNQDVTFLDTLSVAYEANEQFDLALQTIDQALRLASKSNQAETIAKLKKRRAEIAKRVAQ